MLENVSCWLALLLFGMPISSFAATDITQTVIRIYGDIIEPTCKVKDKDLVVDFGTLTNKDLIWHGRSVSHDFAIEFECATNNTYEAAISFIGQEAFYNDLQRRIMIEGDTPTNPWGIAIQMTTENGTSIPINAQTVKYSIKNLSALNFKAFVEASQSAISRKHIRLGEFNAIAHFVVEYQ
jgi:type 1 fimbria pilin